MNNETKTRVFVETVKKLPDLITDETSQAAMYMGNIAHKIGPSKKIYLARAIDDVEYDGEYRRYYYIGTTGALDKRMARLRSEMPVPVHDCLYSMTHESSRAAQIKANLHKLMGKFFNQAESGWYYVPEEHTEHPTNIFMNVATTHAGASNAWRYEARPLSESGRKQIKKLEGLVMGVYDRLEDKFRVQ